MKSCPQWNETQRHKPGEQTAGKDRKGKKSTQTGVRKQRICSIRAEMCISTNIQNRTKLIWQTTQILKAVSALEKETHIPMEQNYFTFVYSQGEDKLTRTQHRCVLIRETISATSAATLEGEGPLQRRFLKPEREIHMWLADTVRDLHEILTSLGWQVKSCTQHLHLGDWSSTPVTEILL